MNFESPSPLVRVATRRRRLTSIVASVVLAVGSALLILPTMYMVATETWTTEQGGHGPLVLATGLWAIWKELSGKALQRRPGRLVIALPLVTVTLALFTVARITGILEIEAFLMYGAVISGAYLLFGGTVLRAIWFPLVYLAFALPPPNTVVAAVTQPIKIAISSGAVHALHLLGYPIASSGVTIQIAQYQLQVAAACAGLNSIVTLGALCLFYVYLRHRSNLVAFAVIAAAAIPVAVLSNFVRILTLILMTYYLGDAVAQGFAHDFAGLLMFVVALLSVFGIDQLASPLYRKWLRKAAA